MYSEQATSRSIVPGIQTTIVQANALGTVQEDKLFRSSMAKPNQDIVLIGYPIWWGVAAWPVNNFVKDNDFTGETVIPFCTSASSGLGQSGKLLEEIANGGNWKTAQRFSSSASDADIKKFTDSLK